jgi:hypothetical protein
MVDEAMQHEFRDGWWSPPASVYELAPVEFGDPDGNLVTSRSRFVVPDVEPGTYHVMFCTEGCEVPMASQVPVPVQISDEAGLVRAHRWAKGRIEGLRADRAEVRGHLRRYLRKHDAERAAREEAEGEVEALRARIERLSARLDDRPSDDGTAWSVAGVSLLVLVLSRIRRRSR